MTKIINEKLNETVTSIIPVMIIMILIGLFLNFNIVTMISILIVTIVNQDYAEKVMTEAKKGGATGGTTINGRGLESGKALKILNISIEP